MHSRTKRFLEVMEELKALHIAKSSDYGSDKDPFANLSSATEFGVEPWVGAMIRLNDKVKRLQAFAKKGSLANESVDDSLRDISVYAAIAVVLYEEASKNDNKD